MHEKPFAVSRHMFGHIGTLVTAFSQSLYYLFFQRRCSSCAQSVTDPGLSAAETMRILSVVVHCSRNSGCNLPVHIKSVEWCASRLWSLCLLQWSHELFWDLYLKCFCPMSVVDWCSSPQTTTSKHYCVGQQSFISISKSDPTQASLKVTE